MDNIIKTNLQLIKQKIAPCTPNIIAVTKYFDYTAVVAAYNAGIRDFGENRVNDALEKMGMLDKTILSNSRFHLIGHLQGNKVKKAVGKFDLIQSVDTLDLAEHISKEAQKQGIVQKVLIQINNAKELQKTGFYSEEIMGIFSKIVDLKGIKVCGLMNMAPLSDDKEYLRKLFLNIKDIKTDLEQKYHYELSELSMGMSNDYDIAAAVGATMIRIGRKLFKGNN